MKFIENLTRDELVKLTMEEREIYLQRELAKRGIENIEEPELKIESLPPADRVYYKIEGFDTYFENKSDADNVLKALRNTTGQLRSLDYNWETNLRHEGREDYYRKDPEDFSIKGYGTYSENLYVTVEKTARRNVEKRKIYNEQQKVYQENLKKVLDTEDYVNGIISGALADYHRERKYLTEYQRMLNLAEGNESIARNFFSNTYFNMGEEEINDIIALATRESQTEEETH